MLYYLKFPVYLPVLFHFNLLTLYICCASVQLAAIPQYRRHTIRGSSCVRKAIPAVYFLEMAIIYVKVMPPPACIFRQQHDFICQAIDTSVYYPYKTRISKPPDCIPVKNSIADFPLSGRILHQFLDEIHIILYAGKIFWCLFQNRYNKVSAAKMPGSITRPGIFKFFLFRNGFNINHRINRSSVFRHCKIQVGALFYIIFCGIIYISQNGSCFYNLSLTDSQIL